VAASRPAGSLQEIRVIDISDKNMPGLFLLEMAFQTQRLVAFV
jgi:hypothetical protein